MTYAGARHTRIELTANGKVLTLFNPAYLIADRRKRGKNVETLLNKANEIHYSCRGRNELYAWFLLRANDVRNFLPQIWEGKGFDNCSIVIKDEAAELEAGNDPAFGGATTGNHIETEIKKLYAVEAYAVTGVIRKDITKHDEEYSRISFLEAGYDSGDSITSDPYEDQMYLVKVVDYRYWHKLSRYVGAFNLKTRWWLDNDASVVYKRHEGFIWKTMLDDLWGTGQSALDHSNANYSLEGPKNYYYFGVNALDAFHHTLNDIEHTIVRNLDGTSSVWDMGTEPPSTSDTQREKYKSELLEVSNDSNGLTLPEKIWVIFPRLDYNWQTSDDPQEVTANDYWHNHPCWAVEKDTKTLLAYVPEAPQDVTLQAGTCQILHDSLPAQWAARLHGAGEPNEDPANEGSILPINNSQIATQVQERALRWIKARVRGDKKIVREVYQGYIPFEPSHDLSKIIWKNTGRGAVTIIESCPIASEEDYMETEGYGRGGTAGEYSNSHEYHEALSRRVSNESPSPPDHARWMEPAFRWALIKPDEDIAGGAVGTCSIEYGISENGDEALVFHASLKDIEVKNIDDSVALTAGERYFAWFNEQMRFWLANPRGAFNLRGGEICATVDRGPNMSQASGKNTARIDKYGHDDCIETVKFLRVNKQTMLRSYKRGDDYVEGDACGYAYSQAGGLKENEMLISFNPSRKIGGGVLWSDGNIIRWSRAPKLASYLEIGDRFTGEPPRIDFLVGAERAGTSGYTLTCQVPIAPADAESEPIGGSLAAGGSHSPAGNKTTSTGKLIFPNDDVHMSQAYSSYGSGSLAGQHLTVRGHNNSATKMKWTKPGLSGNISILGGDGSTIYTFSWEDGILVKAVKAGNDPVVTQLQARWNPGATYVGFAETLQDPCADAYAGNASNGSNRDASGDPS